MHKNPFVTASEIGDFIYCKRGWWLRKKGLLPTTREMLAGNEKHTQLAALLWWHKLLLIISIVLVGLGFGGIIFYSLFLLV